MRWFKLFLLLLPFYSFAQTFPPFPLQGPNVFYVTGSAGAFATLSSTYTYATAAPPTGLGLTNVTIYDYNLSYSTPEVMYCTPWPNDGTEAVSAYIYLGPGILQFNDVQANGQACPVNESSFGPVKHFTIVGSSGTTAGASTAGTLIQAGSMWSSVPGTHCPSMTTMSPTTQGCLMPLVVIGDWTNSNYNNGAMLVNMDIDCNYKPGCLAMEIREAQENSGCSNCSIKNSSQSVYWHSSQAQNSAIWTLYDGGCQTPSKCLVDTFLPRIEVDNVPSLRGLFGGTLNGGNNSDTWLTGTSNPIAIAESGSNPWTETVTFNSTILVGTPTTPTINCNGGGSGTTWGYKIVGLQTFSKASIASSAGTDSCAGTLSSTNYNAVVTSNLTNAAICKVYRTTAGTSPSTTGYIGSVTCGQTFNDTGLAASTTDTTPATAGNTGLQNTTSADWICINGTGYQGCWQVASDLSAGTSFTFTSASSLGGCASGTCGTMNIVPISDFHICEGASCADSTLNPTVVFISNIHFEHAAYGIDIDSASATNVTLDYNDNTTVASSSNNDIYDLVHIPNINFKYIRRGVSQGSATNSLYEDLFNSCTISTTQTYDPGSNYLSPYTTLTDAGTVTWNASCLQSGSSTLTFTTHGGSRTLKPTNLMNGGTYSVKLIQDNSGTGEGLTLSTAGSCSAWKVSGSGAGVVTLSTAANAVDYLTFTYDGTNCWANLTKAFS